MSECQSCKIGSTNELDVGNNVKEASAHEDTAGEAGEQRQPFAVLLLVALSLVEKSQQLNTENTRRQLGHFGTDARTNLHRDKAGDGGRQKHDDRQRDLQRSGHRLNGDDSSSWLEELQLSYVTHGCVVVVVVFVVAVLEKGC